MEQKKRRRTGQQRRTRRQRRQDGSKDIDIARKRMEGRKEAKSASCFTEKLQNKAGKK